MKDLNSKDTGRIEKSLNNFSHQAADAFNSVASDISATTSDYTEKGRVYIRENPSKSLVLAATAGALVGGILTFAMRYRD